MDTQHKERDSGQSERWLIAHKVRGEAAFDVAVRFKCPICEPIRQGLDEAERGSIHCDECDEGQWWWVIPTSGHRAYPYWYCKLDDVLVENGGDYEAATYGIEAMPADLPDHYQTAAAPGTGKLTGLFSKLGFSKAAQPQVTRRI